MPRGKKTGGTSKAQARRDAALGLTPEKFHAFVREAKSLKQDLDDANMEHASVFKKCDKLGIHPQAVRLYMRLDKMDALKRADFLRCFDQMRSFANEDWNATEDMLEQDDSAGSEGFTDLSAGEEKTDEPAASDGAKREQTAATAPAEAAPKNEADWGDDKNAANDPKIESMDKAGFTFAEGKTAGAAGATAEENPHGRRLAAHKIWERGRVQGAVERAQASVENGVEAGTQDDAPSKSVTATEPDAPAMEAEPSLVPPPVTDKLKADASKPLFH